MNIAIIGSRTFSDFETLEKFVLVNINIDKIETIISGGAVGTDRLAELFADKYKIPKDIIKPEWNRFKRGAGLVRNKEIIDKSDIIFAFWQNRSKGTEFVIREALKIGKKVKLWEVD
ncbi:MAG TPA: SLOG family protein [Spirochaetota bacterium]|nr:SLOG family protein [Spirochaetota bacterium]